jgi:hypothetical protein
MSGSRRALAACAAAALAACASLAIAAPSWGWGTFKTTTIAKGLDNPRDLAIGPDGKLYVAEAGHGGPECQTHEGETACVGFTSGVSRIESGAAHKVLSGFFSISEGGGFGATGIDGISFFDSHLFGIEAGSQDAVPPSGFAPATLAKAREQAGRLGAADFSGHVKEVANVGHFDFEWSKEHKFLVPEQFPDANPYGVLAGSFGELVVDAGANTLDFVSPGGAIQVLAFFPSPKTTPPESDAVPTCLDKGPDGAIYIGELTGAASAPGDSVVWRWTPGHAPTVWARGLTAVTGCGFGPDGQFYAVEFSTKGLVGAEPGTGVVVRVPPGSTSPTTIVSGLSFPGGFAASSNAGFVSNWSIAPANSGGGPVGEVVKITRE